MKLYVCNGTRQVQAFVYRRRIEGSPGDKLITQPIPIGGQIQVSGDLNQYQVDDILDQHRRYGLIPVSEIATGRGLAPLAYQLDAPIDAGKIFRLAARNQGVMVERGKKAWKPFGRKRAVSPALRAYAALTTNAARGAVRDVSQVERD